MSHYIKKIDQINFGLMSPEDIRKMSTVTVQYPDTYGDDGFPIDKGLMDPRLGIIDPSLVCRTCGLKGGDCPGHFGSIELARPVIHVGFGDVIHKILRSTCNDCGRVLLNDEQIEYYTEKIDEAMANKESITNILKDVYKDAKRELKTMPEDDEEIDLKYCCPHCGAPQEAISLDKPVTIRQGDYKLTPSEVRERLEKISDDDAYVLGVNAKVARPEWLVLTVLPVPPVTVRPSITLETGERSEDDLTHKLVDVLRINQRLFENMEAGAPQLIVEDLWELLQYHVTTYFDNEAAGVPPSRHRSGRPYKTLTQRLNGKEGRFRSNLTGKRVNFSARTVISPDPNISINEVAVPELIAKEVTVPVHVNDWNINEIRTYIENGPDMYPGAQYIFSNERMVKRRISEGTKEFISEQLKPGDIVERHLKDGDLVLLNRQPSLHRMSMMAHEVKVLPYKTFGINPCVCPPYNADFDGDEMNMHILQTDESRAEAKSLMRVQEQILSPRFGGPIIGAIHDHITGAFLLTRDGSEFSEEEALQIIRKSHLEIPKFEDNHWILKYDSNFDKDSFIYKPKGEIWTGKELFSLLLPNDLNLSYSAEIAKGKNLISVEIKDEKTDEVIETRLGHEGIYPATEGYVVIKNGILEQGVIDEYAFGSFSGKILDKIVKEYGSKRAKEFLDNATAMAICGIMKTGMTTSLNDEEIPQEAQDQINNLLDKKMDEVDALTQLYELGHIQPLRGRSIEETLEIKIKKTLNEARDMAGMIVESYILDKNDNSLFTTLGNNSAVMAKTGARSSMLNLTQVTACLGQQSIRGERIERGYLRRTLPHFKKGELGAKAKGFIRSSYKSGLDPVEFFFHAMGGREGLVDKAVRTAQSGYMQRRLVNSLQDLQVKSSGLVTDNQGNVIQTMYGDDGVDPAKSDFGKPADLNVLIDEIRSEGLNNKNSDVNLFKVKLEVLLDKLDALYSQVSNEIQDLSKYKIEHGLDRILEKVNDEIISLEKDIEIEDSGELSSKVAYYQVSYNVHKADFDEEINKINNLYKDKFKNEVNYETNLLNAVINNLTNEIENETQRNNSLITALDNLNDEINNIEGNFTSDLIIQKQKCNDDCSKLKSELNSNLNTIKNIKLGLSNINAEFDLLSEFSRINKEFFEKSDNLEDSISEIKNDLNSSKSKTDILANEYKSIKSSFNYIVKYLTRIGDIFIELNNLEEPIVQIEQDIIKQREKQSNITYDLEELITNVNNMDVVESNLAHVKKDIEKNLEVISIDLETIRGFELDYRPHFPVLKQIRENLMQNSMNYATFEHNFELLNGHIEKVQDKIQYYDIKLENIEKEISNQKNNYSELLNDLENYKRKLIFDNQSDNSQEESKFEDNESVLEFRNYTKHNPFFGFTRNKFVNISDDEVAVILREIENDIVEGKITSNNWNTIVNERFEKFNHGSHVENLINQLNDIISNSEFYSSLSHEFSDLTDEEKNNSIDELKNSFTSDFKPENIETNLKIIFREKRKEKQDLMCLEECKNKKKYYISKYQLYDDEFMELLDVAEKDIYDSKLRGILFEEYMHSLIIRKVDEDKRLARSKFSFIINKKSKLKELTSLNDHQVSLLINDVQLLISNHQIRDNQINDEFLIECSIKYKNDDV